jgi:hypothetical protein
MPLAAKATLVQDISLAVYTHPQVVNTQHVHAVTTIKKAPKGTLRASESFIV